MKTRTPTKRPPTRTTSPRKRITEKAPPRQDMDLKAKGNLEMISLTKFIVLQTRQAWTQKILNRSTGASRTTSEISLDRGPTTQVPPEETPWELLNNWRRTRKRYPHSPRRTNSQNFSRDWSKSPQTLLNVIGRTLATCSVWPNMSKTYRRCSSRSRTPTWWHPIEYLIGREKWLLIWEFS